VPSGAGTALTRAEISLSHGEGPAGPAGRMCTTAVLQMARCPSAGGTPAPTAYLWNNLTGSVGLAPSPRITEMAYDASDGYVLLYGGVYATVLGDTWTYANGNWTNITASVTGQPPLLDEAAMAFDPSTGKVILFGGDGTSALLNETWSYHAHVWTNLTGTAGVAPSPRRIVSMVTDSTDTELVLVGGDSAGQGTAARDTWTFKGGNWTNVTLVAPLSAFLQLPVLSNDPSDSGVLLTGEASTTAAGTGPYFMANFLYSGGSWRNLTPNLTRTPPISNGEGASMGYLPSVAAVVLYLGFIIDPTSGTFLSVQVTWEYVAGAWVNITGRVGAGPGLYLVLSAAAVSGDSTFVSFGGEGASTLSNFTWVLAQHPQVTATSSRTVSDVGLPVTFTGGVASGLAPNRPLWKFGDGVSATTLIAVHSYASPGLFTANLTVTDLVGVASTAATSVYVNSAPTVAASVAPTSPTAGGPVELVALVSGGTAPFTYAWNLGDRNTSATATVTYTYAAPGTYVLGVLVTDALGATTTANVTLIVGSTPASSTAVSLTSGTGLLLLIGVVALAVLAAVLLLLLLLQRGRGPRGPPVQYSGTGAGPIPPGETRTSGPSSGETPPPPAG
jgi:PKD repeat protein